MPLGFLQVSMRDEGAHWVVEPVRRERPQKGHACQLIKAARSRDKPLLLNSASHPMRCDAVRCGAVRCGAVLYSGYCYRSVLLAFIGPSASVDLSDFVGAVPEMLMRWTTRMAWPIRLQLDLILQTASLGPQRNSTGLGTAAGGPYSYVGLSDFHGTEATAYPRPSSAGEVNRLIDNGLHARQRRRMNAQYVSFK
ncbi:hypothetical protein LX36DRAFT_380216 [Colletotrichum falcatum]|nr:hypothetical protein LX36DRAFT_380216 [Colletotrichum falcatum]